LKNVCATTIFRDTLVSLGDKYYYTILKREKLHPGSVIICSAEQL